MTPSQQFFNIFGNEQCPFCHQLLIIDYEDNTSQLKTHFNCDACELSAVHAYKMIAIFYKKIIFNLLTNQTIIFHTFTTKLPAIKINKIPDPFTKESVDNFLLLIETFQ